MLPSPESPEISPAELSALLADDPTALRLIDCREEDEFAICRIAGAELLPLSRFGAEALTRLGGEERPIVVYCHHGMRSLQATMHLRARGLAQVWSLAGGIDLWSREVDPGVGRY